MNCGRSSLVALRQLRKRGDGTDSAQLKALGERRAVKRLFEFFRKWEILTLNTAAADAFVQLRRQMTNC